MTNSLKTMALNKKCYKCKKRCDDTIPATVHDKNEQEEMQVYFCKECDDKMDWTEDDYDN